MALNNPLLQVSPLPNFSPEFSKITNEHYFPAIEQGIEEARERYETIKNDPAEPDFENTILAMEISGETLGQATSVFYNMLSAMGGDELHAGDRREAVDEHCSTAVPVLDEQPHHAQTRPRVGRARRICSLR